MKLLSASYIVDIIHVTCLTFLATSNSLMTVVGQVKLYTLSFLKGAFKKIVIHPMGLVQAKGGQSFVSGNHWISRTTQLSLPRDETHSADVLGVLTFSPPSFPYVPC